MAEQNNAASISEWITKSIKDLVARNFSPQENSAAPAVLLATVLIDGVEWPVDLSDQERATMIQMLSTLMFEQSQRYLIARKQEIDAGMGRR